MTPTILGGLNGIRTAGTASFGVLVSPSSPGSASQAIGHCSFRSKTPPSIGAHVETFA
jgi:hypothetical protein